MPDQLFIACGVIGSLALVLWIATWLLRGRESPKYRTVWSICILVHLILVVGYAGVAFASFKEGPRQKGTNFAGPSGYIGRRLLVAATAAIAAPASFVSLLMLSLLPPKSLTAQWSRRIAVYGALIAIIAAVLSLYCLTALAADIRREREKPKPNPFDHFKHLRTEQASEPTLTTETLH